MRWPWRREAPADTGQLRSVSVVRAVAMFLVAGFAVLGVTGVVLALVLRQSATSAAVDEARMLTAVEAKEVIGPLLRDEALVPGAEYAALDQIVRERVLSRNIVRVKIWDADGRIVYSDDPGLVGQQFPLQSDELEVLRTEKATAEVTDLSSAENRDERQYGRLLQAYQGVETPSGRRLLFETYQPYQTILDASRRTWLTSLPVMLGGLILLYLVQAPLAYTMARRLKRSQDEREGLLLQSLAVSDRERATIAADLHDGVVQGLSGASYSLSAAAERARDTDPRTAEVMAEIAMDLRGWMRELRSLVVTIIPPALHMQGLAASIGDLAATLDVRGLDVTVDVADTEGLDETTETLVYRAAQEAVRNIIRHADASTVTITVAREGTSPGNQVLVLRVRDDGNGFTAQDTEARRRGSVGLGLLGAVVTSHGGTLEVDTAPGRGTEIVLRVPVTPPAPRPEVAPAWRPDHGTAEALS